MKLMTVDLECENGVDFARWNTTGETSPAEAFDRLVLLLAQVRAELQPSVPDRLPLIIKAPPQVTGPGWQWAIEGDGTLVLNLRHPGLGWIGFRMPDAHRFSEDLLDVLDQRTALQHETQPPSTPN
jgi:hypothetical protein